MIQLHVFMADMAIPIIQAQLTQELDCFGINLL